MIVAQGKLKSKHNLMTKYRKMSDLTDKESKKLALKASKKLNKVFNSKKMQNFINSLIK